MLRYRKVDTPCGRTGLRGPVYDRLGGPTGVSGWGRPAMCARLSPRYERRRSALKPDDWFLRVDERGNRATEIDRRRGDGQAWTEGNRAEALVHGASYFPRLLVALRSLEPGDLVALTDWRGDADELLDGPGTELGAVLAGLAERGVHVRGLLWRSHLRRTHFNEEQNLHLGEVVNRAGGEILLDERVRGPGSQHQKLVLARHPGHEDDDVAFLGGIDLCHGRRDDDCHLGDPQPIDMDRRYGPRPAWHDVQLEVRGPAVGDLAVTFRERWEDPTPLDHRNPWRALLTRRVGQPRHPDPLPPMLGDPGPAGPHAVQVLRTYPAKRPELPFAPKGERSIARAYAKAFWRARRLIYLEDQYLWSVQVARLLADALRRSPELRLVAVVPRYPDEDGWLSGPPHRIGQQTAMDLVRSAGGERVAVYDLENEQGRPIYVHAKVCVVDDVWAVVGSDNFNRRSWTHDAELTAAVLDDTRDPREPADPAGLGDGARVFARELRLRLWREHLGRAPGDDADLLDPERGFRAWQQAARALTAWDRDGRRGPRPPGRATVHDPGRVQPWAAWWARPVYTTLVDPDGRPRRLRRSGGF
jgi:phosphatidylserine/phosphatidylglycerophosphate/cardiolipin synthase-like enzyme